MACWAAASSPSLILRHGDIVEEVEVAHVRARGVLVLVHKPLPLGGVGVACADVLGLQELQLAMDDALLWNIS